MSDEQTILISNGFYVQSVDKNKALAADEMYELLERLSPIMKGCRYFGVRDEIDNLLAKARGEL